MDWIETVGDTIEDAKDTALDRLGVAIDDVEFEVVDDAETGWFGRVKSKARVRARVKPNKPREKQDDRGARRGRGRGQGRAKASGSKPQQKKSAKSEESTGESGAGRSADKTKQSERPKEQRSPKSSAKASKRDTKTKSKTPATAERGDTVREDLSVDEQAEVAKAFMTDLLVAFEIDGTVEISTVDEDTREVSADGGDGIGLLIGPKGRTIDAIQELVRTTVQRRSAPGSGRVKVDIAGYRQRRKEALERFVLGIAEEVVAENEERALEPMSASDRKIVHDAVSEFEGVDTRSDGEDPRRRVVLVPSD
ncbi:MAG: Jag N-terminal domain-containing protein [Acidobacteria bacterium]|nr:Jag N-terminal domain-containing protein [Acidobacteriota bacterium]